MNIFETNFNYESRVERLRKEMDKHDLDCMLVHLWTNQYYVSGFYHHLPWYPLSLDSSTESPLVIFRDPAEPPIFLCGFFVYNAIREGTWLDDVRAFDVESKLGAMEYLAQVLAEKKKWRTEISGSRTRSARSAPLQNSRKLFPRRDFTMRRMYSTLRGPLKSPRSSS